MRRILAVTEARKHLADLIDTLDQDPIILVRRSRPVAILLSPERYEALIGELEHLEAQAAVLYAQLHPEEAITVRGQNS